VPALRGRAPLHVGEDVDPDLDGHTTTAPVLLRLPRDPVGESRFAEARVRTGQQRHLPQLDAKVGALESETTVRGSFLAARPLRISSSSWNVSGPATSTTAPTGSPSAVRPTAAASSE
jgi:hypothetical protein